jgi:hydrogenase expression/formation protein HypC
MCLAIPGKITEIASPATALNRPATVAFDGIAREINLCFLPEAQVGDYVLVHVGVAISLVDEHEAQQTLEYLRRIGELDAQDASEESGKSSE